MGAAITCSRRAKTRVRTAEQETHELKWQTACSTPPQKTRNNAFHASFQVKFLQYTQTYQQLHTPNSALNHTHTPKHKQSIHTCKNKQHTTHHPHTYVYIQR